jgi:hypothetical protein
MASPLHDTGLAARKANAAAFVATVSPLVAALDAAGMSLREIGAELASRGICARRGGPWTPSAVKAVLAAAAAPDEPVAGTLDRSRPHGVVCGMPGVAFEQDGRFFRHDGRPAEG